MNAWNFDIWFTGSGDAEFATAEQIIVSLAEQDGRVGDAVGARWIFDFGMTELDQSQAIAEVERLLKGVDEAAVDVLSVRPPG